MARRTLTDEEIDASIPATRARGCRAAAVEPRAVDAWYDPASGRVLIELTGGGVVGFLPALYGDLAAADAAALSAVEVEQDGEALHWEALDMDLSVPGVIGRVLNLREWAPRYLGQITSEAKARAARENGKKGGRPRAPRDRAAG